jgi:hypothetical protein
MEPVKQSTLKVLDFGRAATDETQTWRNLLPPEPWLQTVANFPDEFGDYARLRLEVGIPSSASIVVRVRKPHQQTRPVPVVGIPERIAYRALYNHVLATQPPIDRSQEAYQQFIAGPISVAFERKRLIRLSDARIRYVVESDITAFYEYIDHSILLNELQLRTLAVTPPRYLAQLLNEMQGRPFGLPQLLDASDGLSEVYARIIERELRRQGIEVWRYNDDFRIGARTYEEAQAHLEALAREASAVGLVLNERKTRIVKFQTYFWKNWVGSPSDGDIEFKPEMIKVSSDYGELDEDDLTRVAYETFNRLDFAPGAPEHLDSRNLTSDDNRDLGRAIGILTKQADPFGLDNVAELFEYAPHLSHRLGAYLVALSRAGVYVGRVWEELTARSDQFNAWQRLWLVHIARVGKLLTNPIRRAWIQSQREGIDPLLRAEATLALAPSFKAANFDEIDRAIRAEPEGLIPWYALAAVAIPNVSQNRLQALKESHRLIALLLHKPTKK